MKRNSEWSCFGPFVNLKKKVAYESAHKGLKHAGNSLSHDIPTRVVIL